MRSLGHERQGRHVEPLAHQFLERKRHAVGVGETEVRDAFEHGLARLLRRRELLIEGPGEVVHSRATFLGDVIWRAIRAEELVVVQREGAKDAGRETSGEGRRGCGLRWVGKGSRMVSGSPRR